ncbi:MAG: alanine dehydrogenase, partial [Desulfobulbaceae bacterium]|nr:alanine dehydrogenase [Desulfobulbaceae bacterium]
TIAVSPQTIGQEITDADIVVGAVLVPGGKTPVLISRALLSTMKQGAVIVDVSVDQGGCAATSRPTSHDDPVFTVNGIIHYCVANMPGAYPRTATIALTSATLPYLKLLAAQGIDNAIANNPAIRSALNTYRGKITNNTLMESLGFSRG